MINGKEQASKPVKRMPCEVYSRIVGYLRPVQEWNKGKQQEFIERKMYAVPNLTLQYPAEGAKTNSTDASEADPASKLSKINLAQK